MRLVYVTWRGKPLYDRLLIKSIKSARRWLDKDEVYVIAIGGYRGDFDATVIQADPVPIHDWIANRLAICDIMDDEMLYLDADIIVNRDIRELFDGDFEFRARVAYDDPRCGGQHLARIAASLGKPATPMWNGGAVIFKKGLHRRIKKEWYDLYQAFVTRKLPTPPGCAYHWVQLSFALAVAGHKVLPLSSEEHYLYGVDGRDLERPYLIHFVRHKEVMLRMEL